MQREPDYAARPEAKLEAVLGWLLSDGDLFAPGNPVESPEKWVFASKEPTVSMRPLGLAGGLSRYADECWVVAAAVTGRAGTSGQRMPRRRRVRWLLDALAGDSPAEPIVRELLERAAYRLERLCVTMLHRSYPRLTRTPTNLETAEMLGGVVEGLLKAMRSIRPRTVRQFFPLAN